MSRVIAVAPAVAIGAAATMLFGGCSAGQIAQTAIQPATISGVDQTIQMTDGGNVVGQIALRDLTLQFQQQGYQAGADVPLNVRIFNIGTSTVKLCTVSSSVGQVGNTSSAPASTP
ncbi:MAG: hypothetical protein H0T78_11835, partial [Longispora sp.]|nr:hypothetical protein [Longispora sp. (in: high G+C Gram-positive bacteria)]